MDDLIEELTTMYYLAERYEKEYVKIAHDLVEVEFNEENTQKKRKINEMTKRVSNILLSFRDIKNNTEKLVKQLSRIENGI